MKKLLASTLAFATPLAAPVASFAQTVGCPPGSDIKDSPNYLPLCDVGATPIGSVVAQLIQFIFVLAVILALGFLVWGGIKWLTSGGDKENVAGARNTIVAAIIGLIIIFLAYVILNFVLSFLTGQDFGEIQIPTLT